MRYKAVKSLSDMQIIELRDLTEEQRAVLRVAGRERVVDRLCAMLGDGRVSLSQVQDQYGALMAEVGSC